MISGDLLLSFGLETILSSLLSKQLSIKVCFVLSSVWVCKLHPHSGKEFDWELTGEEHI
jgi:hypothetical protein